MTRTAALVLLLAAMAAPVSAQDAAAPAPPPEGADAEAAPAGPASHLAEMGTGSITGAYFPVGVSVCRLANQHRRETGLRCAALPSAGSIDNIGGLRDGRLQLAIVQSDVQADALDGRGPFASAGPFDALASVVGLYPEPLTLVARADAGVARVEDLAGKRVWLGAEGSGTRLLADELLGALGWTDASLAPAPDLGSDGVARALCAGQIDAFLYAIGHPALVIQEATTGCDARLVPIDGAAVETLVAGDPGLVLSRVPGGLYRGNPAPTATFGVAATLVTRADEPEDMVYTIVSSIFGDFEMFRSLDPVLTSLAPEVMASDGLTAPLHPGAARYYRERGWLE